MRLAPATESTTAPRACCRVGGGPQRGTLSRAPKTRAPEPGPAGRRPTRSEEQRGLREQPTYWDRLCVSRPHAEIKWCRGQ